MDTPMDSNMEAKVIWKQGMSFTGTATTGFEVPLGADPAVGGDNDGFRPMELFAVGLAGCTAMDVISILRKKRQDITTFEVRVYAERATEHPKVFTKMRIEYLFSGNNLNAKAIERAIDLSEETYCPAQGMLRQAVEISSSYTIEELSV
jgi:putative redox protein